MKKNLNTNLKILLKNSFVVLCLLFLVGCNINLNKTIEEVSEIDSQYNVQFSDYENGLVYFDTYAREISDNQTILNNGDFDGVIQQLNDLKSTKTDEDSIQYINFRIKLFESEKLYKLAERKPFTNYKANINCNKANEILPALYDAKRSIDYSNDAIKIYNEIDFKKKIDISENWVIIMEASNEELSSFLDSRIGGFSRFCNQSQSE